MTEAYPGITDVLVGHKQWHVEHGEALDVMSLMPDECVDSIITDPPYPEVDRVYGRMNEEEWSVMMKTAVGDFRRVLKPEGSAMIVLQPNSSRVGSLRPWLYEFLAWCCRDWNIVQDFWWWNTSAAPTVHCQQRYGLGRPSVKALVWLGAPDCYRNQSAVLMKPSSAMSALREEDNRTVSTPSGHSFRRGEIARIVRERGGVTPYNLLRIPNSNSSSSSGSAGHPAGTPLDLLSWWCRYITKPGGSVLDPFCGGGTTLIAANRNGMASMGVERDATFAKISEARMRAEAPLLRFGGDHGCRHQVDEIGE